MSITLFILLIGSNSSRSYSNNISLNASPTVERVFIITIDAMRFDIFDDIADRDLPAFEWALSNGLMMGSVVPNPTLTATGHVSISSGANSSVHGIMGNTFYDWKDNFTYSFFSDASDPYRNTTTTAAQLLSPQGYHWAVMNGNKSLTVAWSYTQGLFNNSVAPTVDRDFDETGTFNAKGISITILQELDNYPDMDLIYARFPGVDSAAHYNDYGSLAYDNALISTDEGLQVLLEGLETRGMLETSTFIITGDHGWAPTTDSFFFLEDSAEYASAKSTTGLNPLIATDAGFAFIYFIGETDTTKAQTFASILDTNPNVVSTYVNEEHEEIGMYNPFRGMNVSVWYNSSVSQNFGDAFTNMHGYLNTDPLMTAGLLMFGAGINPSASPATQKAIDITPTAIDLLGMPAMPTAQGSVMSPLINTSQAGLDGSDFPWLQTTTTSSSTPTTTTTTTTTSQTTTSPTTSSTTTEESSEDDSAVATLPILSSIIILAVFVKRKKN